MKALTAQLIRSCGRRRAGVFAGLVLLGVLAALAAVCRGHFTNDLSRLFPDTRETRATFDILHRSHLSDTVQLEFLSSGDVTAHTAYLDRTAERLRRSPMMKQLTFRYRTDDLDAEFSGFAGLTPRFFPPSILADCDPDAAAAGARKLLVSFPAPGAARRLRRQPFNWDRIYLKRLQELDAATGMELDRSCPYFVTVDHRRAMMVVETGVRLGDADAVRRLFAELRACARPLPAGMEMRIVSGCAHTLGNEEVLKRDALIAGSVSLALFLLLFLWAYRGDWRALWIPALPLYASLLALGAMTFFFREICLYVIGLGGCITGLAVDQGIHVYAAFRGGDAEKRTAALAEPMLLSAATSVAVFLFLAVTGIAAYIQLAVFAGLSLVFSAGLSLVVLPQLLDREHGIRKVFAASAAPRGRKRAAAGVLLLIGLAALVLPRVAGRADFALESLDGTPEKTLREERESRAAWYRPSTDTAVLAAAGETGEAALAHLESLAERLRAHGIAVTLPPRPSAAVQRANRERWRSPETAARIADLAARCRAACRRHGLPEPFFDPFFRQLRADIASDDLALPPVMTHIDRRMIKSHGETAAAIALLPDDPKTVRAVRAELDRLGDRGAALLSKNAFRQMIVEELGGRFRWLLPLSVAVALAMLFLVFRRPADVLLAMVPVAVAFSGVTLLMYVTGFRATPAAAFALVLLTGLSVDYGIYAVSQLRHPGELDTRDPILLSAATTVAGAGALLTSQHPALFGTGAVLAPGIALACASGVYLVPLLKVFSLPKSAAAALLAAAALTLCAGCAVPWAQYPDAEAALPRMRPYPDEAFKLRALVTAGFPGREFRFVLAAALDARSGRIRMAGVDPGSGALLFKHDNDPGSRPRLGGALADGAPPQLTDFLTALPEDLSRIFLPKDDIPLAVTEKKEYIIVDVNDGTFWTLYRDGAAAERQCGSFPFRKWRAEYRDAGRRVLYRRFDGMGYTLEIRIDQYRRVER